MPQYQICTIPGRSSRSDKRECEGVKFHRLPQDPDQGVILIFRFTLAFLHILQAPQHI